MKRGLCALAALLLCAIAVCACADARRSGDWLYETREDNLRAGGFAVLTGYFGEEPVVVVPDTVDGYPVKWLLYTFQMAAVYDGNGELVTIEPKSAAQKGEMKWEYADNEFLEEVVVPEGVEVIGHYAFDGCKALRSVSLPQSLREIWRGAFSGCCALERVEIPDSVQKIGEWAFYECAALRSVALPKSLRGLAGESFRGCASLERVDIPDSVRVIDKLVFADCGALSEVTLPRRLEHIGSSAFKGTNLTAVTMPDAAALATDLDGVFDGGVVVNGMLIEKPEKGLTRDGFAYALYRERGYAQILDYEGEASEVIVPPEIDGLPVISVVRLQGANPEAIERIVFSDSVVEIQEWACSGLASLGEVVLPAGLRTIGNYAFSDCGRLARIEIPKSVISIRERAFRGTALTGVALAETTVYDDDVFEEEVAVRGGAVLEGAMLEEVLSLSGPQRLKLWFTPDGCRYDLYGGERYGVLAWYRGGETDVTFQRKVSGVHIRGIAARAFAGTQVERVVIPEGVREIGEGAFEGCERLESVALPRSLRRIEAGAFAKCPSLRAVALPPGIEFIAGDAFDPATEVGRQ